tara:strand:+ start:349 stop:1248 length:900 start_codon:yes stop_codon:yes gene_type:complete
MSEEVSAEEQVEETTETTDEELWEEQEESEGDSEETEGTPEEEPEEVADETEEEEPEEPEHDYETRYKDLEREFHKRNEESARLREEFQELRLRNVEQQQALENVQRQVPQQRERPVDPTDPESFFSDTDKQTMEEFSELSSTFRKMIQHEMAKTGMTQRQAEAEAQQRLQQLEQSQKEQSYQQFLSYHENYMLSNVGEDYRDLDKDPGFQDFVLASPAMTKMMTESTDPIDHASVMQMYLSTDEGKATWRPPKEPIQDTKRQSRRTAASGLLGNSAPVKSKNPDNMSDDELWESIPND